MKPRGHLVACAAARAAIIAATACFIRVAELRWRMGDLVGAAPAARRLAYGLGGVVLMLLASALLFVIAFFVDFGFGPFYLLVSVAIVLFAAIPAQVIPPLNKFFVGLTAPRLIRRTISVIAACLVPAALYVTVADGLGFTLRFGGGLATSGAASAGGLSNRRVASILSLPSTTERR